MAGQESAAEMPTGKHGPSIKDPEIYEALRREGYGKAKAAAISNAQVQYETGERATSPAKQGGKAAAYEQWTKAELYERAQELDVSGRSKMTKPELIDALRD